MRPVSVAENKAVIFDQGHYLLFMPSLQHEHLPNGKACQQALERLCLDIIRLPEWCSVDGVHGLECGRLKRRRIALTAGIGLT